MRRLFWVFGIALGAACGQAEKPPSCTVSADCAVGESCLVAEGQRVCWADTSPPAVSNVVATCPTAPCLRDGVLHVTAAITDDREVLDASLAVSLDATRSFPMTKGSGTTWAADVPLRELPFPVVDGTVTATVTARDGARTPSAPLASGAVAVTRVKAATVIDTAVGFKPTAAAIKDDGTVVVAGSTGKVYFVGAGGSVTSLPVGTGQITAAPAVGARAVWIGSEDGWLYGVKLDGTGVLTDVGVNALGAVRGGVAVQAIAEKEVGFVASAGGLLAAASTVALERATIAVVDGYTVGPVLNRQGRVLSATAASNAEATRRCYPLVGLSFSDSCGTASVGLTVTVPLIVDADDQVWSASQDRKLFKSGTADPVVTVPAVIVDSPIILAGGDVVVGDQSGLLHRYTTAGAAVWAAEPNLGAPVLAPLALRGTEAVLIVPTKTGKIAALRADGTQVWETTLGAGELRTGNVYTPAGQPAGHVVSTVYFPSTDGKLYAVLVDGELDTGAPWPKAFHDARNTNNAGTSP